MDGREEKADDPEEEEEDEQVWAKRKTRGGGSAAEGHVKSKTIKRNRPPLVFIKDAHPSRVKTW